MASISMNSNHPARWGLALAVGLVVASTALFWSYRSRRPAAIAPESDVAVPIAILEKLAILGVPRSLPSKGAGFRVELTALPKEGTVWHDLDDAERDFLLGYLLHETNEIPRSPGCRQIGDAGSACAMDRPRSKRG